MKHMCGIMQKNMHMSHKQTTNRKGFPFFLMLGVLMLGFIGGIAVSKYKNPCPASAEASSSLPSEGLALMKASSVHIPEAIAPFFVKHDEIASVDAYRDDYQKGTVIIEDESEEDWGDFDDTAVDSMLFGQETYIRNGILYHAPHYSYEGSIKNAETGKNTGFTFKTIE